MTAKTAKTATPSATLADGSPKIGGSTMTIRSLRNRDSARLAIDVDTRGRATKLVLTGAGADDRTVIVGAGDWARGVGAVVARMQAVQVSTTAGSARFANRLGGGVLRTLAPNGRHWTGPDVAEILPSDK